MTLYLVDKSAYEQRRRSQEARSFLDQHMATGELATCEIVALEVLYSARNLAEYERLRRGLEAQPWMETTPAALRRAIDVQHELARRGQHRLPLPDLVIAATAETHDAVVLHYDGDFDRIAAVTGQPVRWVAPRGTVS